MVIGFRTVQRASSSAFAVTGSEVPVDTRDYLLSVSSEHGSPVPSLGTNAYAWRARVTCFVESAVMSGLTNWVSAGWNGSGSVPPEGGTTNTGDITLTSFRSLGSVVGITRLSTRTISSEPGLRWERYFPEATRLFQSAISRLDPNASTAFALATIPPTSNHTRLPEWIYHLAIYPPQSRRATFPRVGASELDQFFT